MFFLKELIALVLCFLSPKFSKKGSILMYHSIGFNKKFSTVTPKNFEKQLQLVSRSGYKIVSLVNLVVKIKNEEDVSGHIALTFDDAYEDFYINAYPLLRSYNIPATVFVPTGFIGSTMSVTQGRDVFNILNPVQMQEMSESGLIDFMPHSVKHLKLTKLSLKDAKAEIEQSRSTIENLMGKSANIFAYPSGKYTSEIMEYLKESQSWTAAVSVNPGLVGPEDELFALNRNSIDSQTGMQQFRMKLTDAIEVYSKLRLWKK